MRKTELRSKKRSVAELPTSLPVLHLEEQIENWLFDCQFRQHSPQTIETRRVVLGKLVWFFSQNSFEECGTSQIRQFFAHLTNGHKTKEGRWGNVKADKPVRPSTVLMYYNHTRTFFAWLVTDGVLDDSPFDRLSPPVARPDQIQPFTQDQIAALLRAAKQSRQPRRDEALILLLLDTGIRCSELIGLRMNDIDLPNHKCSVLGKGNKRRVVFFGNAAARSLAAYLRKEKREANSPLFCSDRGEQPLTRSGLFQAIQRLGKAADIKVTRCSPHTFRHTFAIESLRAGANVFSIKAALGHESLTITNRYVAVAQTDCEEQARLYSPADRLKLNSL